MVVVVVVIVVTEMKPTLLLFSIFLVKKRKFLDHTQMINRCIFAGGLEMKKMSENTVVIFMNDELTVFYDTHMYHTITM